MADTDTIHWRLIVGTATKIAALNLPLIGGASSRIYFQVWPEETAGYNFAAGKVTDITAPCVILTPENETEIEGDNSDTGARDYRYPLRIWIMDKSKDNGKGPAFLATRKAIWDALRDLAEMPGVTELVRCTVTPGLIFDRRMPEYQTMASWLTARFETSEERAA